MAELLRKSQPYDNYFGDVNMLQGTKEESDGIFDNIDIDTVCSTVESMIY